MNFQGVFLAACLSAVTAAAQYDPTPPVALEPGLPVPEQAMPSPESVTPRMPTPVMQPIALRVVGSNVKSPAGEYLGRIATVVISGESGQAQYAMLLVDYPANETVYTPIPWGALTYVWDQSQAGGLPGALQVFMLNVDKATLAHAPKVDLANWNAIARSDLSRQIAGFYGMTDTAAVGAPGGGSEVMAGSGSGGLPPTGAEMVAPATAGTTTDAGGYSVGYGGYPYYVAPGFVTVFGTNSVVTNIVDGANTSGVAGIPAVRQTNAFTGSLFRGGTNFISRERVRSDSVTIPGRSGVGAPTGRPETSSPFIGPIPETPQPGSPQ